ncbi:MAG: Acetyltransferase (GNAT) family [Rhodobacteraceae bacterium HLUCCO18]|nr:MAG: Acetyltransferase (GNAT) family [Rhodobacteraceae bacterium HLUCCO18]
MILRPIHTSLPDGTPILIREVAPGDADLLRLGFDHMSDASRTSRFFGGIAQLSEAQVTAFTSPNDRDHVAIGAAVPMEDGGLDPAGTARFVRLPDDPRRAEFALTVVDRYQRRGLGSLLLGVLARVACHNGIDRLLGYVMRSNRGMLSLLDGLDARREPGPDPSVHQMILEVHDDPGDYPATPAGDAMRRADMMARMSLVPDAMPPDPDPDP